MKGFGWRWAALKNGVLDSMAYRFEFLLQIVGSAIAPLLMQLLLWNAIYSQSGSTEFAGMSFRDMIHYTFASVLFSQVRGGDLDFELAEMVRTGTLSSFLLRPVSVIEFVYLRGSGPKFLVALVFLLIGAGLSIATGGSIGRLLGAMLLALMGNIIHFQISAALAAVSFYWEEAYGVLMVKNMVTSLLSGELIPLFLVPEKYAWIWKSTPFYLYVYGPAQYTLGNWTHAQFLQSVLIAGLWILGGGVLIRVSWGLGMKKYLSVGN